LKQSRVLLFFLMILAAGAGSLNAAATWNKETIESRIDSLVLVEKKVSPDGPGYAVAVILDGQVIFKKGYGLASLKKKTPITPATTFNICSMSKQFTAACILLLAQDGKLTLDDEIHKHLPELPDFGQPVTIRHLIHHTSGIWSNDWLTILSGRQFSDSASTEDELKMIFRTHTLNFTPGAEHLYSNSNYVLLGEIVSRLSGKSLADFARERIFQPLGMNNTFIHDNVGKPARNEAIGYSLAGDSTWMQAGSRNNTCVGSNNVYSTVEDLARWERNFYDQKVGGPHFTDMMQTRGVLNNGDTLSYACGLDVATIGEQFTVSHGGGDNGFRTYLMRLPEHGLSAVCLCNSDNGQPVSSVRKMVKIVLGENIFDSPNNTGPAADTNTVKVVLNPATLDLYTGKYQLADGWIVTVTREDSILKGTVTGQEQTPFKLVPETDSLFHLDGATEIKISFHGMDRGPAAWGVFLQDGAKRMDRIEDKSPTTEWLKSFDGEYYSDELNTTYRVETANDRLILHSTIVEPSILEEIGITGNDPLVYSGADTFSFSYIPVIFKRSSQRQVTGFTMDVGRIRNVTFVKR
jgi:CubicO group peptidase (beta-lactamase class C family)